MCAPISPVSIFTALAGSLLSSAMKPQSPSMPAPVEPTPPPQASKVPDQQAVRANRGGGASPAAAGTMLTGPSGVAPGAAALGGNQLLGR